MRVPLPLVVLLFLLACSPAFAQTQPTAHNQEASRKERVGNIKLIAGIAAAGVGAVLMLSGNDSGGLPAAERPQQVHRACHARRRWIPGGTGWTDKVDAKRMNVSVIFAPKAARRAGASQEVVTENRPSGRSWRF